MSRRVKTSTVLQMEAVECGAASLAIILAFHGRLETLETLRQACGVSRDGTKATNIIRAAETYGLIGKGYRKTPETLKELSFPVILHWNMNHFLVLEGFKKDRAYLSDPALGRYSVSLEEFDESFTGVVLAFEKTERFEVGSAKRGMLASLATRLGHSKSAIAFVLLASAGLVIPGLVIPTLTTVFIDEYLVRRMSHLVIPLLLVMLSIMALNAAFTWLQQRYLLRLQTKISVATSSSFLWHVLHLPVEFFNQRFAGEVGTRVEINNRVAALVSGQLAVTVLNLLAIVFFVALMFTYDVWLTLASIAMATVNVVGLQAVARARKDASRRLLKDRGKLAGTTMSGLRMIETLKATGEENDYYTLWSGHLAKAINTEQALGVQTAFLGVLPPLLLSLNTAAFLGFGALRVIEGALSIGSLVAFQYLMNSFIGPVNRLVDVAGLFQVAEGDMERLDDVLRHERAPDLDPSPVGNAVGKERLDGELQIKDLTFGYSRLAPPLIESFSLRLEPGRRVALVGGSGSGKSTIAKLVCGLYEPWNGEVLFDGKPRNALPRELLSGSFALVDQDLLFFEDTILANLSLWDSTLPFEQVVHAAQDAQIHELILKRKGGYESSLDEGGSNFSGGQRQRLEIARALAVNPSVLVLDEATSALDPTTEKHVMDNLRRRGCTCLLVAHRLSTIRDCDEIIVLDHGAVAERGTHEELLRNNGAYAKLIRAK